MQNADAVSFIDIDLSGSLNPTDSPFGIDCTDPNFCYVTINLQGMLAKIDKTTLAVTLIEDDELVSSGQDFYAIVKNPTDDKYYILERDSGQMKVYDVSDNSFTNIALPENVAGGIISYFSSQTADPNIIVVDESCLSLGDHTYVFGFTNFGETVFTNGKVWQALNYNYDFSSNSETCGAVDKEFHGIAEINPATNAVTRTTIAGSSDLRGVTIDSTDSTILWITDVIENKIYKFDTDTKTVIQTIILSAGSSPRGITDDGTFLYVAKNVAGGIEENSEILKIKISDSTTTTIDTGALNTILGTFEVFIANEFLVWTDQSSHVGTVLLTDNNVKTILTTSDTNSNHFGALVGSDIWIAGKGSAKVVVFSTLSSSSSSSVGGGSEHQWKTKPTFGKSHLTHKQIVDDGFQFNGIPFQITDNFHTDFLKQEIKIGSINTFSAKSYGQYDVRLVQFYIGVPEIGKAYQSEIVIEVWLNSDLNIEYIQINQDENIIDKNSVLAIASKEKCNTSELECTSVTISARFLESPFNEVMAIEAIDTKRRTQTTYLNEGVSVIGDSLNPPKKDLMPNGKNGLIEMTLIDKFNNLWHSNDGIKYTRNDVGSWFRLSPIIIEDNDPDWTVMTRYHDNFDELIQYEIERAIQVFDSKEIQNKNFLNPIV